VQRIGALGPSSSAALVVQPGFAGALTLELVNAGDSPIKLYPGLKIAQLTVHSLADKTTYVKSPTYRAPTRPQAARLGKEQAELDKIRKLGDALTRV
jgi:deoxycytidine triphosphate deaminase